MNEQLKLSEGDTKYWAQLQPVVDWVTSQISDGDKVLEIGPGSSPFPLADTFIGWTDQGLFPKENLVLCDVQKDSLPFADNEFDFVYCRHVLEDIYNPFHLCSEMSRVAKAGYIETPSPMAEMCRGIEEGSPEWRGFCHHRYIVWNDQKKLHFLTKYPIVEFVGSDDFDREILNNLRTNPIYWNNYFFWNNEILFTHHQHEIDYNLLKNYGDMIVDAVKNNHAATNAFVQELAKIQ